MAIRRCGICKLALREDDDLQEVRIRNVDKIEGVELGGYFACGVCAQEHRERLAARGHLLRHGQKSRTPESYSKHEMM